MREIVDGMVESRALLFQNKVSNCDAVPGFLSDAGWLWNERDTQLDGWYRRIRHLDRDLMNKG